MQALAAPDPIDYLVIGHIACDRTPNGLQMGGTAAYAALTAHSLGLRVGVVTSWGEEIPPGAMQSVSISNTLSQSSTTFENSYPPEGRVQKLHHRASALHFEMIPPAWRQAPIVHLGPIAQEVDPALADRFPHSKISVTPQGWMRAWDQDNRVRPAAWPEAPEVLKNVQAAVLSLEDVASDENWIAELVEWSRILVITEGADGCRVYWHGDARRFQAPPTEEVDATGAGDIFAAAFFIQLHKTQDPWEAARFANQLAAGSVSRRGLRGVPLPEEIQNARIEVL